MADISVIIPVYNVEKYLNRCVDSVLAQDYDNYEIILVDDGSTDSSGMICDELADANEKIRVIHQKNAGLSAARNTGIENAASEKLFFLDSDDYIEKDALSILNKLLEESDADEAIGGTVNVYGDWREETNQEIKTYEGTGIEILGKQLAGWEVPATSCGKLYKKSAIGENRFPVGKIFEDAYFLPKLMIPLKKVVGTTKPLYIYYHRPDSITTTHYTEKDMQTIGAYEYTMDVIKNDCPSLLPQAERRLIWSYFVVLEKMLAEKNYKQIPEYKKVLSFLKKNWLNVVKNNYFGAKRKIAAIALKVNVKLYKALAVKENEQKKVG